MDSVYAATLFTAGVFLLVCTGGMLGVCCWWFARAVREAHTARAHGAQADATTSIVHETTAALDDLPRTKLLPDYDPPTPSELRDLIRARRSSGPPPPYEDDGEREYTTSGNEGIPDQPPIPPGGMYRGLGDL